jgi:hypothetical protein
MDELVRFVNIFDIEDIFGLGSSEFGPSDLCLILCRVLFKVSASALCALSAPLGRRLINDMYCKS